MSKNKILIFEFISIIVLIFGVYLTSIDYYPYNLYINTLSNLLWMILGIFWKQWSLITVQLIMTLIYIYGLFHYYT